MRRSKNRPPFFLGVRSSLSGRGRDPSASVHGRGRGFDGDVALWSGRGRVLRRCGYGSFTCPGENAALGSRRRRCSPRASDPGEIETAKEPPMWGKGQKVMLKLLCELACVQQGNKNTRTVTISARPSLLGTDVVYPSIPPSIPYLTSLTSLATRARAHRHFDRLCTAHSTGN